MKTYTETCHDPNATHSERENALLAEHVKAVRELEWIWASCKVVYWPRDGGYPIEHNTRAKKYSRDQIEAQMPERKTIP